MNNDQPASLIEIEPIDISALSDLDKIRNWITNLELKLKDLPQMELPLKHHFSKNVYGRELDIPKDTLLIGKIHKHQTMNVVTKGEVTVLSMDGMIKISAPHTFVSNPGAKRVIYAHEDSTWITFHGTSETDVAKIENDIIAKNYDEVVPLLDSSPKEIKCLG